MESRLVFGAPPRSGKFGRQGADGWLFLELCRRCGAYDLSAMRLINARLPMLISLECACAQRFRGSAIGKAAARVHLVSVAGSVLRMQM